MTILHGVVVGGIAIVSPIALVLMAENDPHPSNVESFFTMLVQLATALTPMIVAYIAYKQFVHGKTIKDLEKNTNSMKDQLVKVVGEAEKAKGVIEGRQEATAELAPVDPIKVIVVPDKAVPVEVVDPPKA